MKSINFSHDWNKKVTGSELFSTIRKFDPGKREYYFQALGEVFSVVLKGKKVCEASLVTMKSCRLNEIPSVFLMIDTGMTSVEKIDKLFSNFGIPQDGEVLILVFKETKDSLEETEMNKNMWWGYLHQNGSIQVKRWFGDHKDYTDDCEGNDFVQRVVRPFEAQTREDALEIIKQRLSA